MKNIVIAILFLVILRPFNGWSQTPVSIGLRDSLYSAVLGESRTIWISLPPAYNASSRYPVLYVLDGDAFFPFITGVVNHLGNTAMIPELIVVGIGNTNRFRDLTPTVDSLNDVQPNGGGELFTTFIEKELIPLIEQRYKTAPYRLLMGHSLGGLLAANTFYNHTNLFNAYLILDPSVWWKKMELLNNAPSLLSDKKFDDKVVYLANSNAVPPGMKDTMAMKKDTTNTTIGSRAVFRFRDQLSQNKNRGFRWKFRYYPEETHASVPLISAHDALRFIFDFYKRPSFPVMTDSTAKILEDHYRIVSQRLHYTILPSEFDLNGMAWRSRVLDHRPDRALVFLEMYLRLYPGSPAAYEAMATHLEETGEPEKAGAWRSKADRVRAGN